MRRLCGDVGKAATDADFARLLAALDTDGDGGSSAGSKRGPASLDGGILVALSGCSEGTGPAYWPLGTTLAA